MLITEKLKLDEVDEMLEKVSHKEKNWLMASKETAMTMVGETFYNPGMNELKYQATRRPRTVRQIKIIIFFCKFSKFSRSMREGKNG